jgi:DNA-directed RNA polymerase specialized sigma24 family protein
MTRDEFDHWIGRNRQRLMRLALKVCGRYDAADAVQDAVASVYANETYLKTRHSGNLVAYFGRVVTRCASNRRRGRERFFRAMVDFSAVSGGFRDERGKRTSPARRAE